MKRMTAEVPQDNFETMLNFVHGKDGWAHIYDADGKEINLITWALNHCHDRGCDDFQCETLEEYDEAISSCMVDFMNCPIAMAYCFASQACHLRSRLKLYEDTLFDKTGKERLTLDDLRDLAEPNDPLTLEQLRGMDGEPVYLDFGDGSEWVLVRVQQDKVFITHKNTICAPVNILFECGGKAYRRKPEEGSA